MVVAMVGSLFFMGFAGTASAQLVDVDIDAGDGGDGGDAGVYQESTQTNNFGQSGEAYADSKTSYADVTQIGVADQDNTNVQTGVALAGDGGDGGDGVDADIGDVDIDDIDVDLFDDVNGLD